MKKILLSLFLLFFSLNLFSKDFSLTKDELTYLKNNPIIKVGYSTSFEPLYIEKDDGGVEGIIPDLYEIISSNLGVKIDYKTDTWDKTIQDVISGKIDVIPLMSPKTAKEKSLLVSNAILPHLFRVFAKKDKKYKINSIKDLSGLRIAYVSNIIVLEKYLKENIDENNLIASKSAFDAFEKVLNNKADVALVLNLSGQYLIKKNFLTILEPLYFLDKFKINTVSAVNKNKNILHSILMKTLDSISYEEKLNIINKWTNVTKNDFNKFNNFLTYEEQTYLKEIKNIRVQAESDWAPYNFIKDNKIKGFSNDYVKIIAKLLNKKIEFVKGYSWNNYVSMLKNEKIDIISNMVITDERKKDFIFTENILFGSFKSIFSNEKKIYSNLTELKNKSIGLVNGYYEEELIKKHYPTIKIKKYRSNMKLIEALLNKDVDAVIGNEMVVKYLLVENFITSITSVRLLNNKFPLKSVRMAFNKKNHILKSIIDKAMAFIPKEEITNLRYKWTLNIHSQEVLSEDEKDYLKNNNLTIYNTKKGWFPFIFEENNTTKGISVDMWSEIVRGRNVKVKYEVVDTFSDALSLFKKNSDVILTSTSSTKEREKYALFTKPYASFPIAIVTNEKEDFLINLEELEGKTVAVGKNYSAHKLLKKNHPKIKFVPVENTQTALNMLKKGKVYAVADILPVMNYELNQNGFTNLKISGTSKFNFDIQIMVNKNRPELVKILNKLIDNMDVDKKQIIINRWLNNKRVEKRVDYTLAYWILSIALFIITLMLYRQDILKKQKKQNEYEIKKATKELIELNRMHEDTQHLAKMGTIKKDMKNGKYWASKEFYHIFDFKKDIELSDDKILSKIDSEYRSKLIDFFKKNEKYKGQLTNNDNTMVKLKINNELIRYIEINSSYIFDDKELVERKSIIQDVTEKVLAEEDKEKQKIIFMQQSKLASMGEMTGAIAHQWRQPLNELSIRIQKLKYNYAKEQIDEKFILDFIQKNKKTIDFMSKTIDDFRNFFRIDKEKRDFDIKKTIEEVLNIQYAQLKSHNIGLNITGENFEYKGFKTEFQQAIINLINNSKDALVSNKIIEPEIKIEIKKGIIILSDNGGGIKDKILHRIFEPYFTTKEQGEGTGMGLYMSKMIIEDNMNGKIDINNCNNGTSVTIDLRG